jgi:hypothetical protein
MLDIARRGAYADQGRWIDGDANQLGTPDADLAIMTGHVAQFFLTDESWSAALIALHAALRSGERLSFESRNPSAREWEQWTPEVRVTVNDPTAGPIETWPEVSDVRDGIVSYAIHYVFANTGEDVVTQNQLRFRTEEQLTQSLTDAGFGIDRVYGDWDRRPAGPTTRELIVVASR